MILWTSVASAWKGWRTDWVLLRSSRWIATLHWCTLVVPMSKDATWFGSFLLVAMNFMQNIMLPFASFFNAFSTFRKGFAHSRMSTLIQHFLDDQTDNPYPQCLSPLLNSFWDICWGCSRIYFATSYDRRGSRRIYLMNRQTCAARVPVTHF